MCGIAAIFGTPRLSTLLDMLQRTRHRGEDNTSVGEYSKCVIGINRLSIVDVAGGNQPLSDPSDSVHVVCNGEIYNHREIRSLTAQDYPFSTSSDAEVILPLYSKFGKDCVKHMDGMFAFVIYDERAGTFMAARDRYGIKPLYYLEDNGTWYFASEAKAFLNSGLPIERIEILPPGCRVTSEGVERWYVLEEHCRASVTAPGIVRALLQESVKKHLMMDSDIQVGTFLSGGIDSSIITALVARYRPDVTAFTIGVENSPDVEAARRVTAHLGIRHVVIPLDLREVHELLPKAIYSVESYNQMLALEGLMSAILARTIREHGIKVVLCGEGADEIFAGYGVFRNRPPHCIPGMLREAVNNINNTECLRLDRATMAYSVEARVPYLDPSLVEYAINLPVDALIRAEGDRQVEKWILRKACEDLLPPDIVWRMKLAFDHGSGILGVIGQVEADITDEELAAARKAHPDANINSKLGLHLFRLWKGHFGAMGGADVFRLFGHYPTLQAALDARTAEHWGTGEPDKDLELLESAAPVNIDSALSSDVV